MFCENSAGGNVTVRIDVNSTSQTVIVRFVTSGELILETTSLGTKILLPGENTGFYSDVIKTGCATEPEHTYNIEIIDGEQYGTIFIPETGEWGKEFLDVQYQEWYFFADGEIPEEVKEVRVKVSTNGIAIQPKITTITINPFLEPVILIDPPVLSKGETANIYIRKRNEDGSVSAFPINATFEIGIVEGCVDGTIVSPNGTGPYFYNVKQPLKFVAADHIEASDTVKLRIGIVFNGETGGGDPTKPVKDTYPALRKERTAELNPLLQKIITSKSIQNIETACYTGNYRKVTYGVAKIAVEGEPITILLGESKYFQLKFDMVDVKLVISEIIPDNKGVPHQKSGEDGNYYWITNEDFEGELYKGEPFKVWGTNPVTVLSGGKSGVYWEKEKDIWGTSTKLDPSLIRIVGRYWEENKKYKIKLSVNGDAEFWGSGVVPSIEIEVVKPNKISSMKYKKLPTTIKDVDGTNIILDNLIIEYAGKSGILPQIIKAQMLEESTFRAAYRYEPFPDADGVQSDFRYTNNRYKVKSAADIGNPSIPTTHTNVRPHDYWRYQGTIWDFFYAHSSTLNKDIVAGSNDDLYPQTNSNGRVLWYSKPQKKWNETYTKTYTEQIANKKSENEAIDLARDEANKWLKEQYNGGIMKTGIAQTRMAASYGILQVTYYRALEKYGYVENNENYPERLNEVEFALKFWQDILLGYLTKEKVASSDNNEYNWKNGYETTLRYALGRYRGIRNDSYGKSIINNSKKFNIE